MKSINPIQTSIFQMTESTHALLRCWMKDHGIDETEISRLPKLGLMVSHCNTPVAVGFLRRVEGGIALIDGFICDPKSTIEIRDPCLDQLAKDLIEIAKHEGIQGLLVTTVNPRVVKRAQRLGFSSLDHQLLSLRLNCSTWNILGEGK